MFGHRNFILSLEYMTEFYPTFVLEHFQSLCRVIGIYKVKENDYYSTDGNKNVIFTAEIVEANVMYLFSQWAVYRNDCVADTCCCWLGSAVVNSL